MLTRRGLWVALSLGMILATVFWWWRREPCGELQRAYQAAYSSMAQCALDSDCVLDPPPVNGPFICDPVRANSQRGRERLVVIERNFEARGCVPKPTNCTLPRSARCESEICVAKR